MVLNLMIHNEYWAYKGFAGRGISAGDMLREFCKPASPCEALKAEVSYARREAVKAC